MKGEENSSESILKVHQIKENACLGLLQQMSVPINLDCCNKPQVKFFEKWNDSLYVFGWIMDQQECYHTANVTFQLYQKMFNKIITKHGNCFIILGFEWDMKLLVEVGGRG